MKRYKIFYEMTGGSSSPYGYLLGPTSQISRDIILNINKGIDLNYKNQRFNIGDKVITLTPIDFGPTEGNVGVVTQVRHRYADSASKKYGVKPHYEYYVKVSGYKTNNVSGSRYYASGLVPYNQFINLIKKHGHKEVPIDITFTPTSSSTNYIVINGKKAYINTKIIMPKDYDSRGVPVKDSNGTWTGAVHATIIKIINDEVFIALTTDGRKIEYNKNWSGIEIIEQGQFWGL